MDINTAFVVRLIGLLHVENRSGSFGSFEFTASLLRFRSTLKLGRIATSIMNSILGDRGHSTLIQRGVIL